MVKKFTARLAMTALVSFGLGSSMGSGCSVDPATLGNGDCGPANTVCLLKTIHPGLINGQSDFFELETPEAANDCHAKYLFGFRWADPVRQLSDTDMPPLENLARAFSPGGEFAYFPHPEPVFKSTAVLNACGANQTVPGWWVIEFSSGNQNSALPTTRYYVGVRLDPNVASSLDDTEIYCKIEYYDKPKQ